MVDLKKILQHICLEASFKLQIPISISVGVLSNSSVNCKFNAKRMEKINLSSCNERF